MGTITSVLRSARGLLALACVGFFGGAFAAATAPRAYRLAFFNVTPSGWTNAYNQTYSSADYGLYAKGEAPAFGIRALEADRPAAGETVDVSVEVPGEVLPKAVSVKLDAKGEALLTVPAPRSPGWVRVSGTLGRAKAQAGAICDWNAICSSQPPPADFKAFWEAEIATLKAVPLTVRLTEVEPLKALAGKVRTWEFEIACAGPRPSTGYISMPVGAKPKSLPLYVGFNGAGDVAAYRSDHYGEVAIAIQVNKFGIPNGLGQAWDYAKTPWYASDIKDYAYRGMESPKTAFFKWMILRNLRAMEYGKSLPEWNGRDFLLNGESLGGGQTLIMGALDPDVTFVSSCVPALCDHNARLVGRCNGYPQLWKPEADGTCPANMKRIAETARYFDAMNFCTLFRPGQEVTIGTGFCDTMCPPDGVIAAYRNIPGGVKKYLWLNPPAGHDAGNWHAGKRIFDILGKW